MNIKFKDEIDSTNFDNLMEEDENIAYVLSCVVSNIKREVIQFWILFFLFKKIRRKKGP